MQTRYVTYESRFAGYFCSESIFNLSHCVLAEAEIKLLEKGLVFGPIQSEVIEPELKQSFNEIKCVCVCVFIIYIYVYICIYMYVCIYIYIKY